MTTILDSKKAKNVGSWQASFVPTYSERVKKSDKMQQGECNEVRGQNEDDGKFE